MHEIVLLSLFLLTGITEKVNLRVSARIGIWPAKQNTSHDAESYHLQSLWNFSEISRKVSIGALKIKYLIFTDFITGQSNVYTWSECLLVAFDFIGTWYWRRLRNIAINYNNCFFLNVLHTFLWKGVTFGSF